MTHKTLAVFLLLLAFCSTVAAQQHRSLAVSPAKDPPVEIVSIELNGQPVRPDVTFTTSDGWTEALEIKVRNVSDQPISSIEFMLVVDSRSEANTAALTSAYRFGYPTGSLRLQPNEIITLKYVDTTGDLNVPGNARILMRGVFWNGDDSLQWYGGKMLRRVQGEPGAPPTYKPISLPMSKYRFPRGYQPDPKLIKASASVNEVCTAKFEDNWFKYCNKWCGPNPPLPYHCFVQLDRQNVEGCASGGCDMIPLNTYRWCHNDLCGQNSTCGIPMESTVIAEFDCHPAESPIIIDVLGNGYQLTDIAGGVAFNLAGRGSRLTSWTAPNSDEAFLAMDRNNNGMIDDGTELFGTITPQSPSQWAPNGFRALAELDADKNGMVTSQDKGFAKLILWRDANHNGVSEPEEMVSAASAGYTTLETGYKSSRKQDEFGNLFRYRAKARRGNAVTWAYDIFLLTS